MPVTYTLEIEGTIHNNLSADRAYDYRSFDCLEDAQHFCDGIDQDIERLESDRSYYETMSYVDPDDIHASSKFVVFGYVLTDANHTVLRQHQ